MSRRILEPNRQTNQAIGNADALSHLARHIAMRHAHRMRDQRLGCAQILRQHTQPYGIHQSDAGLCTLLQLEGQHAALQAMLTLRQLTLRKAGESRVVDAGDIGMLLQPLGNDLRAARVLLQTQRQRLDAACGQPGFMRGLDGAERLADEPQTIEDRFVTRRDEPPTVALWPSMYLVVESMVMSAPRSSGRSSTGVRKVLSTTSSRPAGRVIAAMAATSVSLSVGFAGRLDEDHPGGGPDCGLHGGGIGRIDEARFNAEVAQYLIEEPDRASIDHVREHDVVAGLEQCEEDSRDGGHAGGVTDCWRRVLKRSERLFKRGDSGVRGARVGVALVDADGVLAIGRGLIDGGQHGAGGGIGAEAAADCAGEMRVEIKSLRSGGGLEAGC